LYISISILNSIDFRDGLSCLFFVQENNLITQAGNTFASFAMALVRQESKPRTHGCLTRSANTDEGRKMAATGILAIAAKHGRSAQNDWMESSVASSKRETSSTIDHCSRRTESDPTTRLARVRPTPETDVRCRLLLQVDTYRETDCTPLSPHNKTKSRNNWRNRDENFYGTAWDGINNARQNQITVCPSCKAQLISNSLMLIAKLLIMGSF
jgi:hypothetical protein